MLYLIWTCLAGVFLVSLSPFSPKSWFLTDTLSHFVLQAAAIALVLLGLALVCRLQGQYLYLGILTSYALCLFHLWPYINTKNIQPEQAPTLKIMQANVWVKNKNTNKMGFFIEQENPDIIIAAEVNTDFAAFFEKIKTKYPHQKIIAQNNNSYGMAVLSKHPFSDLDVKYLASSEIPSIFFMIDNITFVSIHTANPLRDFALRDAELNALIQWQKNEKPEYLVVTGDLNATPYCTALKSLTRHMNLVNARKGQGIYGSYSSLLPTALSRIPIDHTLVSKNLKVIRYAHIASIGSDHYTSLTTIKLP